MGFIDFIVRPTWEVMILMLPEVEAYKQHLAENHAKWTDLESHFDDQLKNMSENRKTTNNWNSVLLNATSKIEAEK